MQPYNLDDGVSEYFEFILKGNTYRFRYPTTEESETLNFDSSENEDVKKALCKFITPVDPKAPSFEDILKKMTTPHWLRFKEMMVAEFQNEKVKKDENNQGKENPQTEA